jgi:hypothetical protein
MTVRILVLSLIISGFLSSSAFAVAPPATAVTIAVANGSGFAVTWNAVSTATHYYLWVTDSSGVVRHQVWYTAAQVGCNTAQPTCQKVLNLPLQPGTTYLWVQTWNADGYGPWSAEYQTLASFGQPRLYDATNKFIGVLFDESRILSLVNGVPTIFITGFSGIHSNGATLYYTSANCSGTPHTQASFPMRAEVAGPNAYIRTGNPVLNFTAASSRFVDGTGMQGSCDAANQTMTAHMLTPTPMANIFGTLTPPFVLVR